MFCQNVYTSTSKARTLFPFYPIFFCLTLKAISKVGETLFISDAKGSCVKGQTSTVKTSTGSGTLLLSTYSTSPKLTPTQFSQIKKITCFLNFDNVFLIFFSQVDAVSTNIYLSKSKK